MRVGIDIREFEKGKSTGISRYLRHFLSFVAEEDNKNTYILFGNQKTEYGPLAANQKGLYLEEKNTFLWDQLLLPRAIKKEKIEVFLSPYFKAPFFCPCKKVSVVNDLTPLIVPTYQQKNYALQKLYFSWGTRLTVWSAKRVISISAHTKKDLIRLFSVPETKISVVPLAVDPCYKKLSDIPQEILSRYNLPEKFIFYAGNLKPHKNIPRLIKAYNQLPMDLKKRYALVLGATAPTADSLLWDDIKKLSPDGRVVFTGYIEEKDMPILYNASTVFVFPSQYEGFGLPVLEAMACGTPVITSNVSSLPEVAGNAACYIDPSRAEDISGAMEKVLTDQPYQEDLIQKGLKQAESFTIKKMGARFHEILIHCK